MDLSLSNIFEISVSAPGASIGQFNSSNLAVFTHEAYDPATFGNDGYKLFVSPTGIEKDFGSASLTTKILNKIFGQQPNIRANNGYCAVIPLLAAIQTIEFDAVPDEGTFILDFGAYETAAINFNDTAANIQTKIRAMNAIYANATVTGSFAAGFVITLAGMYGPQALATVSANSLENTNVAVVVTPVDTRVGETVAQAITRNDSIINFFGFVLTVELVEADLLAAALVTQSISKIGFFVGSSAADVEVGGKLDLLRQNGYDHSRGLLYTGTDPLMFPASYAGRGLCVNFAGSNTTITMHLKDLKGMVADPNMDQTLLTKAKAAGADVYASFRGVAKTYTSGKNNYFDNVYNLLTFVEMLQVAMVNTLATVSTKIPQTEEGSDILKATTRKVCEQFVTNQFLAPGTWTSPTTFGDQADFLQNISQRGYFIYMTPISQQPVAEREDRQAPLEQIAIKYAGAFHSGVALININQ